MNAESSTLPNPSSNSHPALQLVSRIDILDTKLRLLELYVSEAQTAAAAESKRLRDQFHAELSVLQAEIKQKETTLETHQALAQQADRNQRKQIQELRAELLEANRLAESRQTELTANKLATTALRERIKFLEIEGEKTHVENTRQMASLLEHIKQLESDNEKARNDAAETNEMRVQFELESAALRQELAGKSTDLASAEAREHANAARYASQTAALQNDVMATKRLLEENQQALEEVKSENRRLHDRIAALNSVHEQAIADAQRAAEARAEEYRQQIAALEQNAVANAELLAQRSQEAAQAQRLQADLQQAIENHAQEAEDAQLKLAELQRFQHTLENQLAEAAEAHRRAEQLEQELRSVLAQLAENQQHLDQRNHEVEILQSDMSGSRAQIAQLEEAKWLAGEQYGASLGTLNAQLQKLEAQIAEKEQQIAAREREFSALQEHAQQLREQLAYQEYLRQQAADEHSIAIGALQLELRQSSDKNIVARQTVEARDKELSELREGAYNLSMQIAALEDERNQTAADHSAQTQHLEAQLREVVNQLGERQQDLEARERELGTLNDGVHELQRQIAELTQARQRDADEHQFAIASLHHQKSQLEAQLEEKQQLIESRENEVTELQEIARGLHEQLQRLEQTHQKVVEEQAARVRDLEEGFSARSEELEAALAQRSEVVAQQVAELEAQRGQIGQLDERITQLRQDLEVSCSEKQAVEEQRRTLQHQLADRQRAFEEAQALLQVKQAEVSALHQQAETERYAYTQRATEWERRFHAQESELQRGREGLTGLRQHLQTLETTHQERLQKTAQELAQTRERYASEISALSDEVLRKEAALHNRSAELAASEAHLNGVIQGLNTELSHELQRGQERDQELVQRRAEIEALRSQVTDLEILSTETEHTLAAKIAHLEDTHAKELADLQTQLQEHVQSLAARESLWLTREANAQAELATLQRSYAEKQALIEQRELAIANLQNQANELAAHCREAEASYNALSEALNESERRLATEIALRQVAILTLQNELADNQRHTANIEQSSSLQINDLQRRLDDNNILLGQRAARLDELNREIDSLHDRVGVLQQTNDQLLNDGTQQKEQFRLHLAELENAAAHGAALLVQRLAELERTQAEVSALRQHILAVESLHQCAQTEHHSARAALQDDLGRARQALEQRELAFEVEARSLKAARDQLAEELGTLQARLANREGLLTARESDCAALRADLQALRVQQADSETAAHQAAETAARSAAEQAQRQAAAQIAEKEALLSESQAIQQAQEIELAALREQAAQLEQLRYQSERAEADYQRAEQVSAELAALRDQLEEKESALKGHEERARALESTHRESLGQLQIKLAQHQLLAESRARQTEDLRSHIGVLQGQLVVLEDNSRAFAERQQVEFARAETSLRADLDELHKQIAEHHAIIEARNVEIDELQKEKVALQGEIERLAAAGLRLSSVNAEENPATYGDQLIEIANLRAEIVEKQRLLEDRNEKLIHAKGELADLHKSMESIATPQDGSRPPAVAATNNDLLWEQLSQNDRAAERPEPAVVNERETGFRVTFDRRHNDNLAMPRSTPSNRAEAPDGVSRDAALATGDDPQGLEFLLRDGKDDGRPLPNNGHDRRWRFSLGKKRRWKS